MSEQPQALDVVVRGRKVTGRRATGIGCRGGRASAEQGAYSLEALLVQLDAP